jgi:hypothetical protein
MCVNIGARKLYTLYQGMEGVKNILGVQMELPNCFIFRNIMIIDINELLSNFFSSTTLI